MNVTFPSTFPGAKTYRHHILRGFMDAGCRVTLSDSIIPEGYWSPPAKRGEPCHIAPIDIDGSRVWYDFSDFPESYVDEVGEPYFKIQALDEPGVIPIGQFVNNVYEYQQLLPELRSIAASPPKYDVTAVFSNIDERNNPPLRRELVTRLKAMGVTGAIGLWRWGDSRPEVPAAIAAERVSQVDHWRRQAASAMCFAMPGVAGDFTRAHAEILGMGVPLVTAESDQRWPGRGPLWWRGLLRDLSNLEYTVDELLHGDTGKMELYLAGEHGLNYYDTYLAPLAMAKRMIEWAT